MVQNKFRAKSNEKSRPSGGGIFGLLAKLKIIGNLESGLPVRHFSKVIFAVVLGVFYVWNTHFAERANREIADLENEVEDLRADVTTLEADYMYSSKQSEVGKRVKELGLEESKEPPYKIVVSKREY